MRRECLLIGCCFLFGTLPQLPAQETADAESAFAAFQTAVEKYRFSTADGETLTLSETPVMNWTNPARNNELGSIFVWSRDGVPCVIGTLFDYEVARTRAIRTKHAFHLLADEAVTAEFEEQLVWNPRPPGVQWKPAAGVPSRDANRRLLQMRTLARRFNVRLSDDKGLAETLRLLPQPIHRYERAGSSSEEGAIFALVTATDPEALLLIESTASDAGLSWRYAFARFHFAVLTADLDGERVWSVDAEYDQRINKFGDRAFQNRVYTTMLAGERAESEPPAAP